MRKNLIALLFIFFLTLVYSCQTKHYYDATPLAQPVFRGITTKTQYINIVYGTDSLLQAMDVYLPANRDTFNTPVVVMVHGGGWVQGDKADLNANRYDTFFNNNGCAFVNVNYRLAPGSIFPAQLDDIGAAIEYVRNNKQRWKINPDRICMYGGSSGGHLALIYAYSRNSDKRIKAVFEGSGPTDFLDSNQSGGILQDIKLLVGDPILNKQLWHDASPVFFMKTAVPTVIMHGTDDVLVYYTQAEILHDSLNVNNVPNMFIPIYGGGHVAPTSVWEQWAQPSFVWIRNFL